MAAPRSLTGVVVYALLGLALLALAVCAFRFEPDFVAGTSGLVLSFLCFIAAAQAYAVNRAARRAKDEQKKVESARAKLVADASAAKQAVFAAVDELISKHLAVLVAKRRKLSYTDDYGRPIVDKWVQEVFYFYDNIVEPELAECNLLDQIATMELDWAINDSAHVPEVKEWLRDHDSIQGCFKDVVLDRILDAVRKRDCEAASWPEDVSQMSPAEYEQYCAHELEAAGWATIVNGGAGDQGVDIVAVLDGVTAVFQCKLYSSPLGNKPVQEIHTGRQFHNADLAVVVSNAEYTAGARAAANQTGVLLLHHSQLREFGVDLADDSGEGNAEV